MTEAEIKEAEKSWRVSICVFGLWLVLYGNWKRRVEFHGWKWKIEIFEFHPFTEVLNWDERKKISEQAMNKIKAI